MATLGTITAGHSVTKPAYSRSQQTVRVVTFQLLRELGLTTVFGKRTRHESFDGAADCHASTCPLGRNQPDRTSNFKWIEWPTGGVDFQVGCHSL